MIRHAPRLPTSPTCRLLALCLLWLLWIFAGSSAAAERFADESSGETPTCVLAEDDRDWIGGALASWEAARAEALGLDAETPPWLVLFDEACVWHVGARHVEASALAGVDLQDAGTLEAAGHRLDLRAIAHDGMVTLPEGGALPAQIVSFASTFGAEEGARHPCLVMALPPIWRQAEHLAEEPKDRLARLMRSVFVHEMAHTRQSALLGDRLTEIEQEHAIDDLDDDIVQRRFGEAEGYAAAYERERDLLFAAAHAESPTERRKLAVDALDAMAARRAKYFLGEGASEHAVFAELDRLFLDFEGVANWAAYRSAELEGDTRDDALALIRRGGRWWSQDEGLALFLALDALSADAGIRWQEQIFADPPRAAEEILRDVAIRPSER